MRLLLNEMYPASVAEALRELGHDVSALQERGDLRGLDDPELFEAAQRERRAVVTENVRHYAPLVAGRLANDESHYGLVFTSARSFPRHRDAFVGAMVRALNGFLETDARSAARGGVWWLERP